MYKFDKIVIANYFVIYFMNEKKTLTTKLYINRLQYNKLQKTHPS